MKRLKIKTAGVTAIAELNGSSTAEAIWQALPIHGEVMTWGDEIYFEIPLKLLLENGRELVKTGELGYWPEGYSFCIFFGQTPISCKGEIRAASPVNIFGKLLDDPGLFKEAKDGDRITVERNQT